MDQPHPTRRPHLRAPGGPHPCRARQPTDRPPGAARRGPAGPVAAVRRGTVCWVGRRRGVGLVATTRHSASMANAEPQSAVPSQPTTAGSQHLSAVGQPETTTGTAVDGCSDNDEDGLTPFERARATWGAPVLAPAPPEHWTQREVPEDTLDEPADPTDQDRSKAGRSNSHQTPSTTSQPPHRTPTTDRIALQPPAQSTVRPHATASPPSEARRQTADLLRADQTHPTGPARSHRHRRGQM